MQSGGLTRLLPTTQVVIVYWAVSKAHSKTANIHSACCYDELWLVPPSTEASGLLVTSAYLQQLVRSQYWFQNQLL